MNPAADRMPVASGLRSSTVVAGELHLALNNTIAAVEAGRQELLRFVAPLALSDRVINRLEVVFEELVSNIVRHGFAPGSDQSIAVRVVARPGAIQLTFEDDGAPFDPLAAPPAERLTSLETARLGGLGLPLVRKMAAELAYEPIASGNRLTVSITTA